jgi:hypothetical protein
MPILTLKIDRDTFSFTVTGEAGETLPPHRLAWIAIDLKGVVLATNSAHRWRGSLTVICATGDATQEQRVFAVEFDGANPVRRRTVALLARAEAATREWAAKNGVIVEVR